MTAEGNTMTPTREANHELQGSKTPDRYPILCYYKYILIGLIPQSHKNQRGKTK